MADTSCPYYQWLFHDIMKSSTGIHACTARPQEWKDANMKTMDYCECNSDNYQECEFYKKKIKEKEKSGNLTDYFCGG